ncbi:MAG: phosphoribosylanthranilate isomerase [Candidatus Acetothermia bacterium]
MPKVKICGNRTSEDLDAARRADALGFIVGTPESSRNLNLDQAVRLVQDIPPFTSSVLVTTQRSVPAQRKFVRAIKPDYLQLHFDLESGQLECIADSLPGGTQLIALLPVTGDERQLINKARCLTDTSAAAILLDTKVGGKTGGTGKVHDWRISRKIRDAVAPFPVILAGGLNPANVSEAIRQVRPAAIDLASGVEGNGEKSPEKIEAFLSEVRDCET